MKRVLALITAATLAIGIGATQAPAAATEPAAAIKLPEVAAPEHVTGCRTTLFSYTEAWVRCDHGHSNMQFRVVATVTKIREGGIYTVYGNWSCSTSSVVCVSIAKAPYGYRMRSVVGIQARYI